MTKVELATVKLWRGFVSRAFRIVMNLIAVLALIVAVFTLWRENETSKTQTDHLRIALCGVAEAYLAAPPSQQPTPRANGLDTGFSALRSPRGADCSPAIGDGK